MRSDEADKNLFEISERANLQSFRPLAARMRPSTLDEFVGQTHFLGPGKLLTRMLQADRLSSLIFHGPPGVGKTSLATVIAHHTQAKFCFLSAPAASVKEVREIIAQATDRLATGRGRTVLFVDEIHRFNRAQQDVLLNDVESGVIVLIGATSENPYFTINTPLLSRSTVFRFEPLSPEEIVRLLKWAIRDDSRGFGKLRIDAQEQALAFLGQMCEGDARRALTALEVGVRSLATESDDTVLKFDLAVAKESIQQKTIAYDGTGDSHYDLASALQKSMRGSDPDATVYWLARMLVGGEDLRFVARRIAVCAAEDVGNADPMATVLAASAVQICELVGLPEAQLALAQAAIYIACAPKSNASAAAIWQASSDVRNEPARPVPLHLKDSHYAAAKKAGFGAGYKYPHDYENGFVSQEYLSGSPKSYYAPKDAGYEKNIGRYLQQLQRLIQSNETSSVNRGPSDEQG